MTTKTTKKGAVKGTVAAAAGVAVLLGGMGTFALWNQSGSIGVAEQVQTGHLTATFPDSMTWKDVTPGGDPAHEVDVAAFRMVPGDVLEGTATVEYSVEGENITVTPTVTGANGSAATWLTDNKLTVTTTLVDAGGNPVTSANVLKDGAEGTWTAKVTIAYDQSGANGVGNANMGATIDLDDVTVALNQNTPANIDPSL